MRGLAAPTFDEGKLTMGAERTVVDIGLLIYPGSQTAAVHGLTDLFEVANRMADAHASAQLPFLRVSHWQVDTQCAPQRVFSSSGEGPRAPLAAVLIPPSLMGLPDTEAMEGLSRWVKAQHAAGSTIGTVCLGAFVLAQTGLLDGRAATTHWTQAKALSERFPNIKVHADKPIIDDGDIITTAGLMAWSELGLRIVDRFLGPSIATATARFLVIEHSDSAQQCGSNFAPVLGHGDAAILSVQHWLQNTGAVEVSLAEMAQRAGLEERTFLRRFRAATGLKPTEYCQHVRVGKAREMLEFTNGTVDHIAWTVGYQDPAAFRSTFKKITGLAPSEYRNKFSVAAPLATARG
jgi:transcriptional regulator GlxA family with amidase domain